MILDDELRDVDTIEKHPTPEFGIIYWLALGVMTYQYGII